MFPIIVCMCEWPQGLLGCIEHSPRPQHRLKEWLKEVGLTHLLLQVHWEADLGFILRMGHKPQKKGLFCVTRLAVCFGHAAPGSLHSAT